MAFFSGRPDVTLQLPQYAQPQVTALNQLTQRGLQNSNFQGIEDLARQQFATKTQPTLNERFQSLGGNGTLGSSGQQGANRLASSNLEAQLAGLRSQHGLQELQLGLKPQFENIFQPGTESGLEKSLVASSGPLLEYGGKMGLDYLAGKGSQAAAGQTANQLGGQAATAGGEATGSTFGTQALNAAKNYGIPAAVGVAAGTGSGYLANKAGLPTDASVGVGTGVGTAATLGTASAIAGTLTAASLAPILGWAVAAGVSAYGLKKLYNWWNQANANNPQRDSLENRMAMLQYGVA